MLDIWGEADPKSYLAIADCLWREYREQFDILVFRCLGPTQQQALTAQALQGTSICGTHAGSVLYLRHDPHCLVH